MSDRVAEALDDGHSVEGTIGTFYDVAPDAKESSEEDDTCYGCHEDHNKNSDANAEESEPTNDKNKMLMPSIIIITEDMQKMQGKHLK